MRFERCEPRRLLSAANGEQVQPLDELALPSFTEQLEVDPFDWGFAPTAAVASGWTPIVPETDVAPIAPTSADTLTPLGEATGLGGSGPVFNADRTDHRGSFESNLYVEDFTGFSADDDGFSRTHSFVDVVQGVFDRFQVFIGSDLAYDAALRGIPATLNPAAVSLAGVPVNPVEFAGWFERALDPELTDRFAERVDWIGGGLPAFVLPESSPTNSADADANPWPSDAVATGDPALVDLSVTDWPGQSATPGASQDAADAWTPLTSPEDHVASRGTERLDASDGWDWREPGRELTTRFGHESASKIDSGDASDARRVTRDLASRGESPSDAALARLAYPGSAQQSGGAEFAGVIDLAALLVEGSEGPAGESAPASLAASLGASWGSERDAALAIEPWSRPLGWRVEGPLPSVAAGGFESITPTGRAALEADSLGPNASGGTTDRGASEAGQRDLREGVPLSDAAATRRPWRAAVSLVTTTLGVSLWWRSRREGLGGGDGRPRSSDRARS